MIRNLVSDSRKQNTRNVSSSDLVLNFLLIIVNSLASIRNFASSNCKSEIIRGGEGGREIGFVHYHDGNRTISM